MPWIVTKAAEEEALAEYFRASYRTRDPKAKLPNPTLRVEELIPEMQEGWNLIVATLGVEPTTSLEVRLARLLWLERKERNR